MGVAKLGVELFLKILALSYAKSRRPALEETQPDHAIRNSTTITKLLLGYRDILKKKDTMEKCEINFSLDIFVIVFSTPLLALEHIK